MNFFDISTAFDEIEKESSRLKITELLANLLKKATPTQASIIAYLSLGELNPTYIGTKFNFADRSMIKVLAKLLDKSDETIKSHAKKLGDLGLVIQEAEEKLPKCSNFSVNQIEKELNSFLAISGEGSVEIKEKILVNLLKQLSPLEAKFVIRIILGKLRLGFSDMTLIDAFSWMETGNKSIRKDLEEAYNVCVDIGLIIKILKEEGLSGIKKINITPGIPLRPAAAERLPDAKSIVKKLGKCVAQPKLDGFRLQVHIDHHKVHFFSRNLQDMSEIFPDLKKAVLALNVKTLIAEGEAISYNSETGTFLPFQETVKRKRKYDIEKTIQDFPLKLYFFDILYLDGQSFLETPHNERRKILLNLFKDKKLENQDTLVMIEEEKIETAEELENLFKKTISIGLEGLVIKKPDAIYQAGKRNFNWIKLKREESGQLEDTIDCVILGYYAGKGKRASFGIGAFLVGVYNKKEDNFQTIAKIGTGLSDEEWKELKKKCNEIRVKNKPKNVDCAKELEPDVWVSPEIVCMVRADEITLSPLHKAGATEKELGLALRFPRFMGYRPDKSALEATTITEIKELYEIQFKKKKTGKAPKKNLLSDKIMSIF